VLVVEVVGHIIIDSHTKNCSIFGRFLHVIGHDHSRDLQLSLSTPSVQAEAAEVELHSFLIWARDGGFFSSSLIRHCTLGIKWRLGGPRVAGYNIE
jgi:hypothetical protein